MSAAPRRPVLRRHGRLCLGSVPIVVPYIGAGGQRELMVGLAGAVPSAGLRRRRVVDLSRRRQLRLRCRLVGAHRAIAESRARDVVIEVSQSFERTTDAAARRFPRAPGDWVTWRAAQVFARSD